MQKALFLDRDGTINVDYGYVYQIEKFELIDGIIELCQKAQEKGYLIIVITNQSGIERGYYTLDDFNKLTQHMISIFKEQNIKIHDVFYCPSLNSPDRKPNPGMFLKAKEKYNIDMNASISVGDKTTDIQAAQKAGISKNFLLTEKNYSSIIDAL
ncbi:MAG: HAD family hydrolase [Alphaproteobacteria bacterium]|nr:HAD family hydrolase [Alphaproteobacteria bacterium]